MEPLTIKNARIVTEIFENYGISTLTYSTHGAENGEVILPCIPDGIICGFEVLCDGKVFSTAKAVNLRNLNARPFENTISLSRRIDGLAIIKFSDIPPCEKIDFSLSVCFKLLRRVNHASISFLGLNLPGVSCLVDFSFKINGEIAKVSSPTHRIIEKRSASCTEVSANSDLYSESFILDIFYKKDQPNGVIISRHPLLDNIALCHFTPRLEGFLGNAQDFEIYASSDCLCALSVLLRSLGKRNRFRVFSENKCVWDFTFATEENINSCLENFSDSTCCDFETTENSKKIIISRGDALPDGTVENPSLIILYGGFSELLRWKELGRCLCICEEDMESLIPLEISSLFSASFSSVSLEPVGGLGVSLVPGTLDEIKQGEVSYCFARHNVIPPQRIRLSNKDFLEEVLLSTLSSHLEFLPVDIMYGVERAKEMEREKATLPYEERCLVRERINDIFISVKIASCDIALVCFGEDSPLGIIDMEKTHKEDYQKFFNEDTLSSAPEIVSLILNSQTTEGIIAKDLFQEEHMLVFSTAICLIALYLYAKDTYSLFAKRSLEFLKGKDGYWAETAIKLWNNDEIDFDTLLNRIDMKIMYERLDELSILLIQTLGRKLK